MKVIESSGATREEAIQRGLAELGVDLHEVERIDVVDEGSKGFLGLGKRPVKVRLSVEHARSRPQRESNRRDSGQDRRPNKPQNQENRGRRGDDRSQNKSAPKDQSQQSKDKTSGQGQGPSSSDNRGGDNRGRDKRGGKRGGDKRRGENRGDARQDSGRDRNRNDRENAPQRSSHQKPKPASGVPKAAPITGKTAANVSEEAMEAQRMADQFETVEENTAADLMLQSAPQEAGEGEVFESISDEQGKEAAALLNEIVSHMDLTGEISFVRTKDGSARIVIESGEDGGILIGKRGVTLEALQYLINRMIAQNGDTENTERVVVDVGDYVDRRHAMLRDMALSMARQAKESRRNVRLKPLSPQERRIIHLTLEKDPQVRTYSTGDSLFRSIVINPVGVKRGGPPRRGGGAPRRDNQNNGASAQSGD